MKAPLTFLACLAALLPAAISNPMNGRAAAPPLRPFGSQKAAAGFSAPRCRIPGYARAVGIVEGGRAGALRQSCLLLTRGKGRFGYEDVDGGQSLTPAEFCPGLVLLRQHRGGRLDKIVLELPARSRMRETSDCCGFDQVRVKRDGKGLHLQLRSESPSRDCFGGSARTALEEIFLLRGARLTLEKDKSRDVRL